LIFSLISFFSSNESSSVAFAISSLTHLFTSNHSSLKSSDLNLSIFAASDFSVDFFAFSASFLLSSKS